MMNAYSTPPLLRASLAKFLMRRHHLFPQVDGERGGSPSLPLSFVIASGNSSSWGCFIVPPTPLYQHAMASIRRVFPFGGSHWHADTAQVHDNNRQPVLAARIACHEGPRRLDGSVTHR